MIDWKIDPRRLKDDSYIEEVKVELKRRARLAERHHTERANLLDDFFNEHESPVDIAVILDSGLINVHLLAYHLKENDFLFYRPKTSQSKKIDEAFLEGDVHPERTLLLFDSDMVKGDSMRESADYLTGIGYSRDKIFGYLNLGCKWRDYGNPELMQIDDLLKK